MMTPLEAIEWLDAWIGRPDHKATRGEFIRAHECLAELRNALHLEGAGETPDPNHKPAPSPPTTTK